MYYIRPICLIMTIIIPSATINLGNNKENQTFLCHITTIVEQFMLFHLISDSI